MPDLERRLEDAFRSLPGPDADAGERARRAALDALPDAVPRRRRVGWTALAVACAASVAGGVALAASGPLPLPRAGERATPAAGPPPDDPPAGPPRRALPPGADGFATLADGRLWLATRADTAVGGLAVSAAAVSPRALNVTVGVGRRVVTMAAAGGRVAWTHPAGGRVVAAAWAPFPIRVAYVAADGRRAVLHVIEGDGDADRVVDRAVAPAAPAWRPDSLALAYVGAGGGLVVRDLAHERADRVAAPRGCRGAVRSPAWSPDGTRLAAVAGGRAVLVATPTGGHALCLPTPADGRLVGVRWAGPGVLVAASGGSGRGGLVRLHAGARRLRVAAEAALPGPARALAAGPAGGPVAVAFTAGGRLRTWVVRPPARAGAALRPLAVLPARPPAAHVELTWLAR